MSSLSNQQLPLNRCPHCEIDKPNMVCLFPPQTTTTCFGENPRDWAGYKCQTCGGMVLVGEQAVPRGKKVMYPSRPIETFDFTKVPPSVAEDFQEALTCYSDFCYNAFAAMCRRTIQSICMNLGAEGKDRVHRQLEDARSLAPGRVDDETYDILVQLIIQGHDGAHPHLPKLSPERACVLLELMKDILWQIYVRKAKVQQAIDLRKKALSDSKPQ